MAGFDYDVIFYRVFCVTLLAVAFTFTVILTNVFVDIDGLLLNKKIYKVKNPSETSPITETFIYDEEIPQNAPKDLSYEDKNYDSDINALYRTKRSLETSHLSKNSAIKKMLTRRLASLLEELDEEEAKNEVKLDVTKTSEVTKNKEDRKFGIKNDDLLHLAMHNILLQGLIGHMDLNDVYKKIHILVQTFNKRIGSTSGQAEKLKVINDIVNSKEILKEVPDVDKHYNYNEEHRLFEELMNCKKLETQIANTTVSNETTTTNKHSIGEDNKVLIKTVIEINEDDNKKEGSNKTHAKDNVEGHIKLIYNGKSIKINQIHDEVKTQKTSMNKENHDIELTKQVTNPDIKVNKRNTDLNNTEINQINKINKPSPLLNKILEEYFTKHSLPSYESQKSAEIESIKTQRSKRQIKIRYSDNVTSSKIKPVHHKTNDDDLYIEIETHFDGKGIKGEKKKKLVRSLIDKIQKALHSDIEQKHDSVEHIKFVKRTQDPIYSQNKILLPNKKAHMMPIEHRQLDPIGKNVGNHENIADRHGDTWKKQYDKPNFLSVSKSVNSAEMNELNIDYETVLKNGISKRLQKPLNTDTYDSDDSTGLFKTNSGNVTLFLKDIDGSGFSIGFNQYEGEPPDKDSMKMFNGIEDLIKEYHKTYDQGDTISNESSVKNKHSFVETGHEIGKRNVENLHNIYRRSITDVGTNSGIHKIFFREDPSRFDRYLKIFKRGNHKLNIDSNNLIYNAKSNEIHPLSKKISLKEVPITVDGKILNKKLNPSEIFTIANLINRKRRSLNVQKISNLKSKIKLNRYLNTKPMARKKVFLINKRNKRQVNNIRIIARDRPTVPQKNSDENIFFISRENSYSDKEIIRAVKTADTKVNNKNIDYFDEESPFSNIYRIQTPNIQNSLTGNIFNTAQRSNRLMSQYPHIFLDKSSNSKEGAYFDEQQYKTNDKPYRIEASPKTAISKRVMKTTTEHSLGTVVQNLNEPKVEEMVGAIIPPLSRYNYKIVVKVSPKNNTNTNSRFKEVHTTVNKSFDENGLRYYTMLNVSQISKIETLNKTDDTQGVAEPLNDHLIDQQNQIKAFLKLHKKNVDIQLDSLLRESNRLEQMIELNKKYSINETIKLLSNVDNDLESANGEKIIRELQDTYNTESAKPTTPLTTSTPVTVLPLTTESPKIDKSIIIDTIKQNEKVTFEILKKIDTNTQILQSFLQLFSDKLYLDKKEPTTLRTTEKSGIEMKFDLSKDWKTYGEHKDTFFIPNELKNDTIPFIYAYQQSIPMNNRNPPQGLASLIYHGHIHSNAVQTLKDNHFESPAPKMNPNVLVNTENSKTKINKSKLLLKELNNFKVIPNTDRIISTNININSTNL